MPIVSTSRTLGSYSFSPCSPTRSWPTPLQRLRHRKRVHHTTETLYAAACPPFDSGPPHHQPRCHRSSLSQGFQVCFQSLSCRLRICACVCASVVASVQASSPALHSSLNSLRCGYMLRLRIIAGRMCPTEFWNLSPWWSTYPRWQLWQQARRATCVWRPCVGSKVWNKGVRKVRGR